MSIRIALIIYVCVSDRLMKMDAENIGEEELREVDENPNEDRPIKEEPQHRENPDVDESLIREGFGGADEKEEGEGDNFRPRQSYSVAQSFAATAIYSPPDNMTGYKNCAFWAQSLDLNNQMQLYLNDNCYRIFTRQGILFLYRIQMAYLHLNINVIIYHMFNITVVEDDDDDRDNK